MIDIYLPTEDKTLDNELGLFLKEDKVLVSSLKVAEIYGKEHKNVVRDIKNILKDIPEANGLNFELVDYKDKKGEKRPCYEMDRQGFSMLVMGFTGAEARKYTYQYTQAFEMMLAERNQIQNTKITPIKNEMAILKTFFNMLEHQQDDIEIIKDDIRLLKEQKPKEIIVEYSQTALKEETIYSRKNIYLSATIGKGFDLSSIALNQILYKEGLIKRVKVHYTSTGEKKPRWIVTDKYRHCNYSIQRYFGVRNMKKRKPVEFTYAWTPKGVAFIIELLKRKGYTQVYDIDNRTKARTMGQKQGGSNV